MNEWDLSLNVSYLPKAASRNFPLNYPMTYITEIIISLSNKSIIENYKKWLKHQIYKISK